MFRAKHVFQIFWSEKLKKNASETRRKKYVLGKNDNEGNFKIKCYAENRKEWKFLHKKSFGWVILRFFCSFFNYFSKRIRFLAKKPQKLKLTL
jgi:hypothetical protein